MRNHAVVIGAGIGGIAAAKVLSPHFSRVTVIEREELPQGPHLRKFIPQGQHINGLLVKGREALQTLFPEWEKAALGVGAVLADYGRDLNWITRSGKIRAFNYPGLESICCSRILLEWLIRTELLKLSNVTLLSPAFVEGLILTPDQGRVQGLRVRESSGEVSEVKADLVIESCGKGSSLPVWLRQLGLGEVRLEIIDSTVVYASRRYRLKHPEKMGAKMLWIERNLPSQRSGVVLPIENGQHFVCLSGANDQVPPSDPEGFLGFAAQLQSPLLHDLLVESEPLGEICIYRGTANRQRYYDELKVWPEGLLALGDSLCAFNPFYGQGVSVAALQALALGQWLNNHSVVNKATQTMMRSIAFPAWQSATVQDRRIMKEKSRRSASWSSRLMRYLGKQLLLGRSQSPLLAYVYLSLFNMKATPRLLLRPDILISLLRVRK